MRKFSWRQYLFTYNRLILDHKTYRWILHCIYELKLTDTCFKPVHMGCPWFLPRELLETTCRLANTLKSHGIQKGDRVAIYMPVSPMAVAAMLACARIGAVHTVVFAGFSSEALAGRIQDGQWEGVCVCVISSALCHYALSISAQSVFSCWIIMWLNHNCEIKFCNSQEHQEQHFNILLNVSAVVKW